MVEILVRGQKFSHFWPISYLPIGYLQLEIIFSQPGLDNIKANTPKTIAKIRGLVASVKEMYTKMNGDIRMQGKEIQDKVKIPPHFYHIFITFSSCFSHIFITFLSHFYYIFITFLLHFYPFDSDSVFQLWIGLEFYGSNLTHSMNEKCFHYFFALKQN